MPSTVQKVSESLPPAIMAVLVVYCIKDSISSPGSGTIATGIAVLAVIGLHLWKRNTLLSIFGGTAVYMVCIQFSSAFGIRIALRKRLREKIRYRQL